MKKIIITGGVGFIGSHTVVEFQNAGYEVVIIDNLSNSNLDVLKGIERITGKRPIFYKTDITDNTELEKIFESHNDAIGVVHFAAYKAVGESVSSPLMYYKNNLNGLLNILEQMERHNVSNLVFSSSCTVYGQAKELPVTEICPVIKAESPYGNTKKISEEIIVDAIHAYKNINAISLRYFNPIGAHPSGYIGELPNGTPNNLLPYITQTAMGIRNCLNVFGNDYNTPDGTPIRDYINVVDLAKAHVCTIQYMNSDNFKSRYDIFNIGTGKGSSVLEIINAFERSTGIKINYKIVGRREGDIEKIWADATKANTILGWHAEKNLSETMISAWNWEQKRKK